MLFVCVTEPNYVDLLSKKVTEKFLEVTHERYKEELGEFFGTVVPGFLRMNRSMTCMGFLTVMNWKNISGNEMGIPF